MRDTDLPWAEAQKQDAHYRELLATRVVANIEHLVYLLDEYSSEWGYEDPIYRYYHNSFKVYYLQEATERMVVALGDLLPECPLNWDFMEIVIDGTGKVFCHEHNENWSLHTRPIVEAFFHARYFLEMVVRHASEGPANDRIISSGYAALLYLYNLR